MDINRDNGVSFLFTSLGRLARKFIYRILSVGPIPNHVAIIMDGNRRYAKKLNLNVREGHEAGILSLICVFKYLYEMGVKYITVYAFSIDNFKRKPDQVDILMQMLLEKTQEMLKQESLLSVYGIRVKFLGNKKLLRKPVKDAAERLMEATSKNSRAMLLICVAYTSTDEIVHAVQESCKNKVEEIQASRLSKAQNDVKHGSKSLELNGSKELNIRKKNNVGKGIGKVGIGKVEEGENSLINLEDIENYLYMAVAPQPDILIRSSGEYRLSNFLLWQSNWCPLYNPVALWPEIGLLHVIWAVLVFQRNYSYMGSRRKLHKQV